jgi:hypothetical protein
MRLFVLSLVGFIWLAGSSAAGPLPVITRDPAQYAQTFADSMALAGVRPIRDAFETLAAPNEIPAEAASGLVTYERAITRLPAQVSRVIEDVELGGAVRTIYLYHYYGESTFIFTRLEFVRVSQDEWGLTRIAFADRWAGIVLATTPGFHSSSDPTGR